MTLFFLVYRTYFFVEFCKIFIFFFFFLTVLFFNQFFLIFNQVYFFCFSTGSFFALFLLFFFIHIAHAVITSCASIAPAGNPPHPFLCIHSFIYQFLCIKHPPGLVCASMRPQWNRQNLTVTHTMKCPKKSYYCLLIFYIKNPVKPTLSRVFIFFCHHCFSNNDTLI